MDVSLVEPVAIDPAPAPVLEIGEAIEALDVADGLFLFFVDRSRDGAPSSTLASTVTMA